MQKRNNNLLILIVIVAAFGGLLFGFDMAVVSGVLPLIKKQLSFSTFQEGWFVSSALLGCVFGVAVSGFLSDRFGRWKLLFTSSVFFLLSIIGCAFSHGFTVLIIFRVLSGFGVGFASNIVPLYLSEIAPANKRGRIVTYYQLAITLGIVVAYLSNYWLLNTVVKDHNFFSALFGKAIFQDVWRLMFLVGSVPSILFLAGLFLIPESPRWLKGQGRLSEANAILTTLNEPILVAETPTNLKPASRLLAANKELWSIKYRKPLLIGLLLPLFSQFCGINAIIYFGPTILNNAGLSLNNSFISQLVFGLANLGFTIIAILTVDRLGRRKLYLAGSFLAFLSLVATGLCFYFKIVSSPLLLISVLIFIASFACSIGPLKFVIASEIFPGQLRAKALSISIMTMWIADTLVGFLTPILLNNFGNALTFYFFSAFCFGGFLSMYFLLPETKGKSLEEIEEVWNNNTSPEFPADH